MGRIWSKLLSPNLLYFFIVLFIVFLAWFVQENLTIDDKTKKITLSNPLVISAVAIVIGVLFNGAVKLHSEMRDRAFDLLLINRKDKIYREASSNLATFFRVNNCLSRDDIIQIYKSHDKYVVKIRQSIMVVGNFFEEMAIAIKYKEVNEQILEEFYHGIFLRFYGRISPFLPILRNEIDPKISPWGDIIRREVYCELDYLYERWKPRNRRRIRRLEKRAARKEKRTARKAKISLVKYWK